MKKRKYTIGLDKHGLAALYYNLSFQNTNFCNTMLNILYAMDYNGFLLDPDIIDNFHKVIDDLDTDNPGTLYFSKKSNDYYIKIYKFQNYCNYDIYLYRKINTDDDYPYDDTLRYGFTNIDFDEIRNVLILFKNIISINHYDNDYCMKVLNDFFSDNIISKESFSIIYHFSYSWDSSFKISKYIDTINDDLYLFVFRGNTRLYLFKKNKDNFNYDLYACTNQLDNYISENFIE